MEPIAALYHAMETSDHVSYINECISQFKQPFYPLSLDELEQLRQNGNTAECWENVRKTTPNGPLNTRQIRDCNFQGFVVLGQFEANKHMIDGASFASGCFRSTMKNVLVLDYALVQDCNLLSNVVVDTYACVVGCGSILYTQAPTRKVSITCANGVTVAVGVETGGRKISVFAELPFQVATQLVLERANTSFNDAYQTFIHTYTKKVTIPFTLISPHAFVWRCSRIENCFIGAYAVLHDSELLGSTLLSTQLERSSVSKSLITNSILQWNAHVEGNSFIDHSFLCDTAHVERHGIVIHSYIGANTSIAEGEVTSCFVGPFVGFHHQALLIACVWPHGKGNVGYGANVGSNHTLKAPDQELFAGEGVFFGLGVCIKFPSHWVHAAYSVIATGVTTLPQRVEMPFALINTPGHVISGLSPAINEISPGWVLSQSVFTLLRNESKFSTRNKSKRTVISSAVFQPTIVQDMKVARKRLMDAAGTACLTLPGGKEPVYTDRQVEGLGKNYMRESSRLDAIRAYTFYIQLFALEGLLQWVDHQGNTVQTVGEIPVEPISHQIQRRITTLHEEFKETTKIIDCLQQLVTKRQTLLQWAIQGKARDDTRGKKIMPDYALVHRHIDDEEAIKYGKHLLEKIQSRVAHYVAKL